MKAKKNNSMKNEEKCLEKHIKEGDNPVKKKIIKVYQQKIEEKPLSEGKSKLKLIKK